ncbi:MAG: acetoacetate decarboxylase family protein [Candidatus Bathyarchaeota archaeon]
MKQDPKKVYIMPLLGGMMLDSDGGVLYRERQIFALQFLTATSKIEKLLPDCYHPSEKPVVTASFVYNDGVDFLQGRGYRIATVSVSAIHEGKHGVTEGSFIVVMYEDNTMPIIGGRELLGVPKLYGDISDPRIMLDGKIRCEVSLYGNLLFGIEVEPKSKQPEQVIEAMNQNPRGAPMLGYKYIHAMDGEPDCSYPIATPSDTTYKEVWSGQRGRIFYGAPKEEDIGFNKSILDAIKSLDVKQVLGVSRSYSSNLLRIDLARRLE